MSDSLSIKNAREHNLKNVSLDLPRNRMIVFTGVSGSGKSSLAFDTIFMEGQRRYIASLSAYARQFIQNVDRPNVDKIDGLSPTVCIDQKSVGRNPRSTVGTITEVYDFLRLLFSRLGTPHCPNGHGPIQNQTAEVIIKQLYRERMGQTLLIMAPMVVDRKGEYRKEITEYRESGFVRILIDGKLYRLEEEIKLARYEKHTLEIVLDRVVVSLENRPRITDSVYKAVSLTGGKVSFLDFTALKPNTTTAKINHDSKNYVITNIKNACQVCGTGIKEMEPKLFSFNSPQDSCKRCQGLGYLETFDPALMVRDPHRGVFEGALAVLNDKGNVLYTKQGHEAMLKIYRLHGINPTSPWKEVDPEIRSRILTGKPSDTSILKNKNHDQSPEKSKIISFHVMATLEKVYNRYRISHLRQFQRQQTCPECEGSGLGLVARYVTLGNRNIHAYNCMQIQDLAKVMEEMDFTQFPEAIWKPIVKEIRERLSFLINVGLDYLTLDRKANTLSGGEAQRIRLAAQVGSGLEGCLYVLDEPSIGLHALDNQKLIQTLKQLQSRQNSLIVIEHDEETMLAADHLVEIGPGAGVHGGEISYNDIPLKIFNQKPATSSTIDYLIGRKNVPLPLQPRNPSSSLTLHPLNRFNLKDLKLEIPLGVMTVLTGVSGSGKSTLLDILSETITTALNSPRKEASAIKATSTDLAKPDPSKIKEKRKKEKPNQTMVAGITIAGLAPITKVIEINQKPIGRTPRSNPATYTDAWGSIRDLFAQTREAQLRGYGKSRFSFNLKGGRCEECLGSGVNRIETQFFSTIEVVCEACDGKRFNRNTLTVHYKEKSIYDILDMTIEEAYDFFVAHPKIERIFRFLNGIGLGYMKVGQNSTTLSGGEAQRIKLAAELSRNTPGSSLYLLDEPTTGLHFSDIEKLLTALHSLIDQGNSIVIIEHNPEVIKTADHIIEMGPQGGSGGGQVVFSGKLSNLPQANTPTGKVMKTYLKRLSMKEEGYYLKQGKQSELFSFSEEPQSLQKKKTKKLPKIKSTTSDHTLVIEGLRKHNLKNIDLYLPKNQLIVFTGVSGSGKSSIAMDSIHSEGQRKYLESLSTYARRFLGRLERPPVEVMENLSPTIAIDQKKGNPNPRSTIATQTEIYDNLRNLFAHVGTPHCLVCDSPLQKYSETMAAKDIISRLPQKSVLILAPLYHPQDQGFLMQKKADLLQVVKIMEENGFLRLLINGEMVKTDQVNASWQKKMKDAFLVVDRVEILVENEERIIGALEKAYQIGNETVAFLDYHSLSDSQADYHWYTGYASCWKHNQVIKEKITPRHFSFNHHLGACPNCTGTGKSAGWENNKVIEYPHLPFPECLKKSLRENLKEPLSRFTTTLKQSEKRQNYEGGHFSKPWSELGDREKKYLLWGKGTKHLEAFTGLEDPSFWKGLYYELIPVTEQGNDNLYLNAHRRGIDEKLLTYHNTLCPVCAGSRLQNYLLKFKINRLGIDDVCSFTISEAETFFTNLPTYLEKQSSTLWQIARETVEEVTFRVKQMLNLGIDYLTLDRETGTLSGGELQRIRLSTQIGNQLRDVIYVLDEPTIGLHEHDNHKLIQVMKYLRDLGNTVIVIEHDAQLIQAADYIVDIGPGAGESGGKVIYAGANLGPQLKETSFYNYLTTSSKQGKKTKPLVKKFIYPRETFHPFIASEPHLLFGSIYRNNIRNFSLSLPLNKLVGISGISGSGKSSLLEAMVEILEKQAKLPISTKTNRKKNHSTGKSTLSYQTEGKEKAIPIERIRVVDQSPVSANRRSTLVSYMDLYSDIRKIFTQSRTAKSRGYTISHFSFNSEKGRCPKCAGLGEEEIEMHFISNVSVICEECRGKRFKNEILEVYFNGKNIQEILEMTFQQAEEFFSSFQSLQRKITRMLEAGLGYLKLGFKTSLLSGGERQRLKIAHQLAMDNPENTLYFLDEPTTGLHFRDIEKLIRLLEKLTKAGGSVVIIEHNIEFLRSLDHIVDLGPGSGPEGGRLIAAGNPRELKQKNFPNSITLKYL